LRLLARVAAEINPKFRNPKQPNIIKTSFDTKVNGFCSVLQNFWFKICLLDKNPALLGLFDKPTKRKIRKNADLKDA